MVILFVCFKEYCIIWFSNLLTLSLPDEGYFRDAFSGLNVISKLLFLSLGEISAGGLSVLGSIIHPVVSTCHKHCLLCLKFTVPNKLDRVWFLQIVVCPVILVRLPIVFSVLLRLTASDCPFWFFFSSPKPRRP